MLFYKLLWLMFGTTYCLKQIRLNMNKIEYNICENDKNSLKINEIVIQPNSPKKGEIVKINMNGFLEKDILHGSEILINVKYKSINLLKRRFDLCEMLAKDEKLEITCPVEKGEKSLEYEFNLPNEIPSGEYKIDISLKNNDKSLILCSVVNMII